MCWCAVVSLALEEYWRIVLFLMGIFWDYVKQEPRENKGQNALEQREPRVVFCSCRIFFGENEKSSCEKFFAKRVLFLSRAAILKFKFNLLLNGVRCIHLS